MPAHAPPIRHAGLRLAASTMLAVLACGTAVVWVWPMSTRPALAVSPRGVIAGSGEAPPVPPPDELAPLRMFRSFTRQSAPGLPQNSVSAMSQDSEGVLWLGTLDGLASFDGRDLRDEGEHAGAPQLGAIYALASRHVGGIYVGGTAGLHARAGDGSWRYLGDGRTVASVAEDEPGRIWVIDQQGDLHRVTDEGDATWDAIELPAGAGPSIALATGTGGSLYIAAHRSVYRTETGSGLRHVASTPGGQRITVMAATDSGEPLVGTSAGTLIRLGPGGFEEPEKGCRPGVSVTALTRDWRQRIWVGCADGRLSVGPAAGPRALWGANEGLRVDARINALAVDRHGTLWIGRNGLGVAQLLTERWRHRTHWTGTERQLPGESVFGITTTDDGTVLIAVFARGIWQWDGRVVREIGAERGLVENTRCAAVPESGVLWVGGRRGLYESRAGGRFAPVLSLADGFVTGLRRGPDGTWYALTSVAGLWARRQGRWTAETGINGQLPHLNVRGIGWFGSEMWLSTGAGLARVVDGRVTRLDGEGEPGPFLGNGILVLPDGELWASGMGGIRIRRKTGWQHLTEKDGLPGRTVYALARGPDGSIWAGGSAGVGRFKDGVWTRYTRTTGLIEDECTLEGLAVLPDGRVLVGTLGSLAVYTPSVPVAPPPPLAVHWRQAPAAGTDGVVRLLKGDRRLRLRWSAPWLTGDPVEYRTRYLEASPEFGAPSDRTEVGMAGLPPGRATFEVQARIGGPRPGQWTPAIGVRVDVAPYVHETWWFRLLVGAGFLSLIPIGVRLRTGRLVKRQQALQQAVDAAVADVKALRGLIPICASCKRIRDDRGAWNQLEAYLRAHSDATLSHGICPDCIEKLYPDYKS